ncbi:unnamed protein product [Urochloa humidicola]
MKQPAGTRRRPHCKSISPASAVGGCRAKLQRRPPRCPNPGKGVGRRRDEANALDCRLCVRSKLGWAAAMVAVRSKIPGRGVQRTGEEGVEGEAGKVEIHWVAVI